MMRGNPCRCGNVINVGYPGGSGEPPFHQAANTKRANFATDVVEQCIDEDYDAEHLARFFDCLRDCMGDRFDTQVRNDQRRDHLHPDGTADENRTGVDKKPQRATIQGPEESQITKAQDEDKEHRRDDPGKVENTARL